MLAGVNRALSALSQTTVVALALTALGLVGSLDYLTGYEISFAVFYLVPVGVAAWYAGRGAGFAFALASSLVWYTAETAAGYPYLHPVIPVWNAFVRLSFFLIIALLLSTLRGRLAAERLLATTDPLTGVLNSRAFVERLERDLALSERAGSPLTLAYLDLDDFKRINDTYGHGEGDRLLRSVGRTLAEGTRRIDTVARLGGDEFALILPATDREGAEALLSKLERTLRDSWLPSAPPITFSIGAAVFRERLLTADQAIAAADRLMYDAKARGKNGIVIRVYSRPTDEALETETGDGQEAESPRPDLAPPTEGALGGEIRK